MKRMEEDVERILHSEQELKERVRELGKQITEDYKDDEPVVLICILRGSVMFFADLARNMDLRANLEFMTVSSYGNNASTSGLVEIKKDLDCNIEGRNVIIAEDIIDSGYTLSELKKILMTRNPKSLKIVCLLDKPEGRREGVDIKPDYCGFTIENEFVVGYGLDYAQMYRNLPYVGVLKRSVYEK